MKNFFGKVIAVSLVLAVLFTSVVATDNYGSYFENSSETVQQKEYKQKFWDVDKSHWAFEAIAELSDRGAINGYPNGAFKPENTVTRAEWAKIMIQAAGLTANDYSVKFADMKGHWAAPYVNAASNYLTAFSENRYRPDQAVTREDVTMAMVKLKGYDLSEVDYSVLAMFKDVASISNSMKVYVAVAVEKGLINGFNDGTFRGQATLTRAQAATLLLRAFQYGNDNKTAANDVNVAENTNTDNSYDFQEEQNYSQDGNTLSEQGEPIVIGNLQGSYWDVDSQRAHMDIKKKDDIYKINIGWGSSATETTEWFFDAKIDKSSGVLVYENGYEFNVISKDDGTEGWELVNEECEGDFEFEGSLLIWNDQSEDTKGKCKFQKSPTASEKDYSVQYNVAKKQLDKYVSGCMNSEYEEKRVSKEKRLFESYNLTRGLLLSCFGYSDSDELLKNLSAVNKVALKFPENIEVTGGDMSYSGYTASLRDSKCFVDYKNSGEKMALTFSYDKSNFSVEFSDVWGYSFGSAKPFVRFAVSLFAENYRDAEFARLLGESYEEAGGGDFGTISMYYGGYNLEISVESAGYSSLNISVEGKKGAKNTSNKTNTTSSSDKNNTASSSQQTTNKNQGSTSSDTSSVVKNEASSDQKYNYVSYYAEYIVDENHTGNITTYSREAVMQHIQREGATLDGEIKVYEKTTSEYMGEYFLDNATGRYYYLEK